VERIGGTSTFGQLARPCGWVINLKVGQYWRPALTALLAVSARFSRPSARASQRPLTMKTMSKAMMMAKKMTVRLAGASGLRCDDRGVV
jgi:hypothetical protein